MTDVVEKALGLSEAARYHGAVTVAHLRQPSNILPDRSMNEVRKDVQVGSYHGAVTLTQAQAPLNTSPDRSEVETLKDVQVSSQGSLDGAPLTHHLSRLESGVDVDRAEEAFAELNKTLSNANRRQSSYSKTSTNDIEKQATAGSWGLEETLRGAKQADEAAGIKSKHIGVIWQSLTVRGLGGVKNYVKVFPDAFVDFFNVPGTVMKILGWGKKGTHIDILKDFKGLVRPGEMCLVLGRPGSGCTTFLKVISNQRFGYTGIDGDVRYGPFDAETFERKYRGEAVYNSEDDVHHPTLTVGQTLGFALDTKTPGLRPNGVKKDHFKSQVIQTLLKMFNIEHTINTIVGNPFMRGVSGGERKRVSIAEMMVTGATVCAWDNTSRGLDASTALDYAKSIRIITNIHQTTTFVSLYQASENIYKQFDKVMVIDSGRQVFFGPASEARVYFEGLGFKDKPRQTTPDYLTGCTDPYEREYKQGRSEANAPSTPEGLVDAFNKSPYAEKLSKEMTSYREEIQEQKEIYDNFVAAHQEAKRRFTPASSVYSIPFYLQIWVLMKRQFLIKWQDKFSLVVAWVTSIVIAFILGTVWLNLPTTSAGAFTRGGLLFISLLFNAFQAFGELGSTMLGRPIVNKHRAYTFHRPGALWIAQILVDLAFSSVKILVFSIIVYFMCGLARTPGAFFTFYLMVVSGYLSMTLFFRTIGCVCPDFDYAIKFASVIITLFVITSGYIIQPHSEQAWLRWLFWVNSLGLGFSSLMMNEFMRIDLACEGSSLIPHGPSYADNAISHKVCTLPGSKPGSSIVSGTDYITTAFSYDPNDLWRNWGIVVALSIAFLVANTILGEAVKYGAGGKTITWFLRENTERKLLNQKLVDRKSRRQRKEHVVEDDSELNIASKCVLTWENLTYDVPVPSGQLRLLKDVFGYVRPGQLTALMGASGAGKTTLLDVLAARKTVGVIGGDVLVDGAKPGKAFQRSTSYAEQLDVHEATQTVREALRFSADLRQPLTVPQDQKFAYVEEILCLLELETLADAIIGTPESGLSVEERKRVTIGVELAAKPELLLFLDEPTSGLDSQSAFNIIRFLRKLAAAGQAILCTIHQPNSALFENFDRLLLLQKGGETVYFGEVGKDGRVLVEYLASHGAHCPPDANVAEFMLDAIGAGVAPRMGNRDWGELWRESEELAQVKRDILGLKQARQHDVANTSKTEEREYASTLWHQTKVVSKRMHIAFWRSPNYGFTRLFNHVAVALFSGLAYLQLDDSRSSLQYRVFVIFQVTIIPALILAQVEPMYDLSRLIFYRESAAKAYRQFPFAFAMVCAEMPYSLLCAIGFFVPIYYLPGFNATSSRAGLQFLFVLSTELFSVTLGQMVAAITPSSFISNLVNPFIVITFALFCGVTIPKPQIPGFWRAWLYELDPFTRLVGGMVVTELYQKPVVCTSREFNSFPAPPGQSCGNYMRDFFDGGGVGYLLNNATEVCHFCAYNEGNQFYEPIGFEWVNRWRDWGILTAFIGSNLFLLFLGSRYLNFNRR